MRRVYLTLFIAGLVFAVSRPLAAQPSPPTAADSVRLQGLMRSWAQARAAPDSLTRLADLRPLADSLSEAFGPHSVILRFVQTELRFAASRALLDSIATSRSCADARRADSLLVAGYGSAIWNDRVECDTTCRRYFDAVFTLTDRVRTTRKTLCGVP